jgi:hypothetical protein
METTIIKKGQKTDFSMIEEKIIFLIIREILTTNPNIKVDKDNFYLEKDPLNEDYPQKVNGTGQSYFIYDGYKLSLKQTENGLCLIVGIKNRIKGDLSVYDALMDPECNYGEDLDESIENLVGKRFIPDESSKSKVIYDIDPDRTPSNTSRNYGKESYTNYIEFFKKEFNKDIKHVNQPMILVKFKGPEGEPQFNYYVPEFCKLCGINEYDIQDYKFMNELSEYTKLNPDKKIKQINKCLDLFKDKTERNQGNDKNNKNDKKVEDKKEDEKKDEKKDKKKEKKKKKKKRKQKKKKKKKKKTKKFLER